MKSDKTFDWEWDNEEFRKGGCERSWLKSLKDNWVEWDEEEVFLLSLPLMNFY